MTDDRWLAGRWVTFVGAVVAWRIDQTALCMPESWFQLHALWHVLAAVGLACWAAYYTQFSALRAGGSHG